MKYAVPRWIQLASMLGAILMMATACAPVGADLYQQARGVNLVVKDEIASLQLRVFDGEWDVQKYGDIPSKCGADGYRFTFGRSTPQNDGWRLPDGSLDQTIDALSEWLDEHGWSGIVVRSYSGDVQDLVLEAHKPSAHIELLVITVAAGQSRDWMDIDVTSTCEPGSADGLADLMFPDGLNGRDWSQPEHPAAEPRFGFATPTPRP
ncbi:hypothetical protein [Microbacterium sp. NPDC087868]|uniref:hypothetical protein n=1 Tax=Microbacterium sp. NPDC087868 TaxID=3364195 RepID=UPI00384AA8F4